MLNSSLAQNLENRMQSIHSAGADISFQEKKRISEELLNLELQHMGDEARSRFLEEFAGMGPVANLVANMKVTEIIITAHDQIYFESSGKLVRSSDNFISENSYVNFIERLLAASRSVVTLDSPFCNFRWQDFRVHVSHPELAHGQYQVSMRRISKTLWNFEKLKALSWANEKQIEMIQSWVKNHENILVVGATGSGKTSVLGACLSEIPANERVIILEDTDEIPQPNACSSKLLARFDAQRILKDISLTDLISQSLRMRPDRLIIGEVRGGEAKDLLLALSTGHRGSLTTLHAHSAQEALKRLEILIQLGAPQWSLETIRKLVFWGIQKIIVVGKTLNGERVLQSLHELSSVEDFGILIQDID